MLISVKLDEADCEVIEVAYNTEDDVNPLPEHGQTLQYHIDAREEHYPTQRVSINFCQSDCVGEYIFVYTIIHVSFALFVRCRSVMSIGHRH